MKRVVGMALALVLAGCAKASGPAEIQVAVTEAGFEPDSVAVGVGQPATLILTRKTDATCATSVVFTETGRRYELPLNTAVRVALPTDQKATLHYACGMDMYHGKVSVR